MKWVRTQFGSVDVDKWRLECRDCGAEVTDNDHVCEAAQPPLYMPGDGELMAARGAIISYIDSIANGNLEPRTEVLDTIIKAVVLSLRWSPAGV